MPDFTRRRKIVLTRDDLHRALGLADDVQVLYVEARHDPFYLCVTVLADRYEPDAGWQDAESRIIPVSEAQ